MITGKPRDAHKEQQWRRRIREQQASGLTVRDYCGRHGLSEQRFYTWRRELSRRDAEIPTLVPVQIVPEDPAAAAAALEVVLPGGRRLRVAPGFDAPTLRQLLAVLEEPAC